MSSKLLISVAASAALAFATLPLAHAGEEGSDKKHKDQSSQTSGTMDQNQQAATQGQAGAGQRFDELDRNQDGQLDEEELNVYGATAAGGSQQQDDSDRGERMMNTLDQNDDGKVDEEEFNQASDTGRQFDSSQEDKSQMDE